MRSRQPCAVVPVATQLQRRSRRQELASQREHGVFAAIVGDQGKLQNEGLQDQTGRP